MKGGKKGGRERGERRGAKGKISPCNDHGGAPQKPQSVANKKSTEQNKNKNNPSHQNTRSTKCCCHPNAFKAYQSPQQLYIHLLEMALSEVNNAHTNRNGAVDWR